jgi:heme exporter protein C
MSIHPSNADAGDLLVIRVQGYNTHFATDRSKVRAWLKWDQDHAIAATQVLVVNDYQLRASFIVPIAFPSNRNVHELSLIIDNPEDGSFVQPGAVFVKNARLDNALGNELWSETKITGLHQKSGIQFPYRNILNETIRNVYFHVPMWFGMILLFLISAFWAARYIRTGNEHFDLLSSSFAIVGIVFGCLGIVTGALWAKYTWGAFWSWDVKQNVAAIALLIYMAYFVLRSSFEDGERKARLSAVYNLFAFVMLIPLLFIIPRMTESLHPGNGGNPALGGEDLDNTMRLVFYPAIVGWTLLGYWISKLVFRIRRIESRLSYS